MPKGREILRRIQSIKSTRKTTYAMKLVAGAKLKKIQDLTISSRDYERALLAILSNIFIEGYSHVLFEKRADTETKLIVAIGSSRGLCGGFNSNLKKALEKFVSNHCCEVFVVGRKLAEILRFTRKFSIIEVIDIVPDLPDINFTQMVVDRIKKHYLDKRYQEVKVLYTNFFSVLAPKPEFKVLLPMELEISRVGEEVKDTFLFEPGLREALDYVIPRLVEVKLLQAFLESKCSEHASRMVAMENATRNAGELAEKLTLVANKLRQSGITAEILDIIGGAEAAVSD
ncbi:MAG: ATP synthase F1 subunit gamma [Deltaproteobacteria bacterium]|nr:ATP synthase F1 subunit gamma [Deltaproteobacteria bacterium]